MNTPCAFKTNTWLIQLVSSFGSFFDGRAAARLAAPARADAFGEEREADDGDTAVGEPPGEVAGVVDRRLDGAGGAPAAAPAPGVELARAAHANSRSLSMSPLSVLKVFSWPVDKFM